MTCVSKVTGVCNLLVTKSRSQWSPEPPLKQENQWRGFSGENWSGNPDQPRACQGQASGRRSAAVVVLLSSASSTDLTHHINWWDQQAWCVPYPIPLPRPNPPTWGNMDLWLLFRHRSELPHCNILCRMCPTASVSCKTRSECLKCGECPPLHQCGGTLIRLGCDTYKIMHGIETVEGERSVSPSITILAKAVIQCNWLLRNLELIKRTDKNFELIKKTHNKPVTFGLIQQGFSYVWALPLL